mmetsp:Transcript_11630/g.17558  ORF Transcript_11630/g.17558 Transcript_11630/m.17558 type:complete len:320 (-) Transcript_11630:877-1836(-)
MTDSQQMVLANETDENNHHDGAITVYTPSSTDLVIHDPERFHFLSPKSNIRKFESEVLKRQAEYSSRISDLEGRLALFHARLAIESAERGREHASTMEDFVNVPLEEAMIRSLQKIETDFVRPIMNHKRADDIQQWQQQQQQQQESDVTDNSLPNIVSIERRANLLEAQMNHHNHVTLFQSRRNNFDTIDELGRQKLQPSLALEMTKADKREGGLIRRFEAAAGVYTRRLAELQAARVAALGYIQKEINALDLRDATRIESHLAEIKKLKDIVLEEREIRLKHDELVVDTIIKERGQLESDIFEVMFTARRERRLLRQD